jgi:hypothetical protein
MITFGCYDAKLFIVYESRIATTQCVQSFAELAAEFGIYWCVADAFPATRYLPCYKILYYIKHSVAFLENLRFPSKEVRKLLFNHST